MHSVAPATLWNVPAAQSVHVGAPPHAENVPGAHCTGSVEPDEHAEVLPPSLRVGGSGSQHTAPRTETQGEDTSGK